MALGYVGQAGTGVTSAGSGSVKIRLATDDDCTAIHDVHVRAVKGLQKIDPRADEQRRGVDEWLSKREPRHVVEEMHNERFVVVEDEAGIVGFGALHIPKREITSVFVNPAHQRKGIGRAILSELEEIARAEGLTVVKLRATGTAIDFYLLTGYQSDPPVEPGAQWALMKKEMN